MSSAWMLVMFKDVSQNLVEVWLWVVIENSEGLQ
jgi:hypothetical protein